MKNKSLLSNDKLVITFNLKNEPVTVPTSEEFYEIEKSSDIEAFTTFARAQTRELGSNLCLAASASEALPSEADSRTKPRGLDAREVFVTLP